MSDESVPSAFQRFARDLRQIREQRDVSIAALHEATQVPESHIQEFEEGTLYEKPRMNDVYLKAFIRAYAQTLGIPSDPVVEQLEAALEEDYEDQLAAQFLGAPASDTGDPDSSEPRASSPANREPAPDPAADSAESPAPDPREGAVGEKTSSDSESGDIPDPSDHDEDRRTERVWADSPSSSPQSPGSERSASGREGAASASSSVDSGVQRLWSQYGGTLAAVALVLLVLALGAGGASVYFGGEGGGTSPEPAASAGRTGPSAPPDTNAAADTATAGTATTGAASASQPRRPPADVQLGDTLYLTVEATSVVAGMRVQQDDDLRRPYWIEPGEAQVFPFARRITVENQLDSLRLFLEGYPYPTTRTNDEGQIIISRDTAEQFVDTLRGAPASFPTPSDTVRIGPGPGMDAETLTQNP
ncbi:MAG: helix-turn-helix domain-containing protein [Salinibacter sp.]